MPISPDILDRLRDNDPSLTHLDLTAQVNFAYSLEEDESSLINLDLTELTHASEGDENARLRDPDIRELCEALRQNTYLKSLNLNKNNIGVVGITALARTKIESLSLSLNGLDSTCVDALMLSETLTSLDVSGNLLNDGDIAKLARHSKFTSLNVSNSFLGELSMQAFGENETLERLAINNPRDMLDLREFELRTFDLTPLGENKNLKYLEMRHMRLNLRSAYALSTHPQIEVLDLKGSLIERYYKKNILAYILAMPKLLDLDLQGCNWNEGGYYSLNMVSTLPAIVNNERLQSIKVKANLDEVENRRLLSSNHKLTTIFMSVCGYKNHPYAERIAKRNFELPLFMLLSIGRQASNKSNRSHVMTNDALCVCIALFLTPSKEDPKEAYASTNTVYSFFNDKLYQQGTKREEFKEDFPSLGDSSKQKTKQPKKCDFAAILKR